MLIVSIRNSPPSQVRYRAVVNVGYPGRGAAPLPRCPAVASASYAVQIAGCGAFIAADGTSVPLLLLGVVLFGAGFGNGTWLPPLIAQVEFVADDVPRVVALIVAISQAAYAFAPVVFGMIREFTAAGAYSGAAPGVFAIAGIVQGLAICAFLAGRSRA